MSQVGSRLAVASSAKISRPRLRRILSSNAATRGDGWVGASKSSGIVIASGCLNEKKRRTLLRDAFLIT
jgi:hypothetical protein